MRILHKGFLAIIVMIAAISLASPALGAESATTRTSLRMMQRNVELGYTMEFPDGGFAVGMTPGLFSKPVRLTQKKISATTASVKNKQQASDVYEYSFRGAEMNSDKPVWVAIKLNREIDPYHVFRIHVYDTESGEWRPIPSSMDTSRGKVQAAIHTPWARVAVFEEDQLRTEISGGRRTNGFEFVESWGQFALAIFADTYKQDQRLRIKRLRPEAYGAPDNMKLVGNAVFEYDVVKAGAPAKSLGVRMKYGEASKGARAIYLWEGGTWHRLTTRDDMAGRWMTTTIDRSYAIAGLFEDAEVYEGVASFYGARNSDDAATHLFSYGTRLRVTNIETGASTIVTVRSTWGNGNHPTRIIDLARSAFAKIEDPSQGLARVRIERAE